MTSFLPSDTEQTIYTASAAMEVPLHTSRLPLGEQSSCPESEKHQDVSGTPFSGVIITSMHYVSLFDIY